MAGEKIRVNTNSLDQTRQAMENRLNNIKKAIGKITEDMATLNSMWDGEAHTAFDNAIKVDIRFLESACESIQGIVRYEDNAVREYNKCEQQVADIIAQISI